MAFFDGFSTIFCLICGLLAWILPFWGTKRLRAIMASLLCCALSLGGVVLYVWTEAHAGDFAAIEDTAGGFVFAVLVMVLGTLLSNLTALVRQFLRKRKEG